MDKETENIFRQYIQSLTFEECPSCGHTKLMIEEREYSYIKFNSKESKITEHNLDLDTLKREINCLNCDWKKKL